VDLVSKISDAELYEKAFSVRMEGSCLEVVRLWYVLFRLFGGEKRSSKSAVRTM